MDQSNFTITKALSKQLANPTSALVVPDIKKCKNQLKKVRREVQALTDSRRVAHSQTKRYASNYTKQQYERILAKEKEENRKTQRTLSIVYADAYNAIMLVREFFTGQTIDYTGAILSSDKTVNGSFTITRDEFFKHMSITTKYDTRNDTVVLKVVEPLNKFKEAIEDSIRNDEISLNEQVKPEWNDKIHVFNKQKQAVYNHFDKIVREDVSSKKGMGGWIFEGFNRMYHLTQLTDLQETQYLRHLIGESPNKIDLGKDRTIESYHNFVVDLMSTVRSDPSKGFQGGDVDFEQIKKGEAELVSGTYLINTLDELCMIFDNLEKGCYEEAETSLLSIFSKDPGANQFVTEIEKEGYNEAAAHIRDTVQNIYLKADIQIS